MFELIGLVFVGMGTIGAVWAIGSAFDDVDGR
jgi:hypothetical protein